MGAVRQPARRSWRVCLVVYLVPLLIGLLFVLGADFDGFRRSRLVEAVLVGPFRLLGHGTGLTLWVGGSLACMASYLVRPHEATAILAFLGTTTWLLAGFHL